MPRFGPIRHRDFVAALRRLGWTGPFGGGKHLFMCRGDVTLTIPNPHRSDIGVRLLALLLRQAGLTREVWEKA